MGEISTRAHYVFLLFELTMPNNGSWNNKWSGENDNHYLIKRVSYKAFVEHYAEYAGKSWYYRWSDGWTACITCEALNSKEIVPYRKKAGNFCGYDWMVSSIMQCGEIVEP